MTSCLDVTTTNGTAFTKEDTCDLASLVFKRFGSSLNDAAAAWNRMLGLNCAPSQFAKLLATDIQPHAMPVALACPRCGSNEVRRDAKAGWSVRNQTWELIGLFDEGYCDACGCDGIKRFTEKKETI